MSGYCYDRTGLVKRDGKLWVDIPRYPYKKYGITYDYKTEKYGLQRLLPGPYEVTIHDAGKPTQYYKYILDDFFEPITDQQFLADNVRLKDIPGGRMWTEAARIYKDAGYEGPLPHGAGNALRVFVKACPEYADNVRQGVAIQTVKYGGQLGWEREVYRKGYLFKSPIPGFSAIDLLKLCKLLKKNGKRYAEVIKRLAENPQEAEEARGLLALNTLAEGFV